MYIMEWFEHLKSHLNTYEFTIKCELVMFLLKCEFKMY